MTNREKAEGLSFCGCTACVDRIEAALNEVEHAKKARAEAELDGQIKTLEWVRRAGDSTASGRRKRN